MGAQHVLMAKGGDGFGEQDVAPPRRTTRVSSYPRAQGSGWSRGRLARVGTSRRLSCIWPSRPRTSCPTGLQDKHRDSPRASLWKCWTAGPKLLAGDRHTCAGDRPGCPSGDLTRRTPMPSAGPWPECWGREGGPGLDLLPLRQSPQVHKGGRTDP